MEDISKPLGELRTIVSHFGRKASKNVNSEDSELLEKGMLEFLELKAANLVAHRRTETKKGETQSKKQTVDATNLQLNNLNYEKNHYVKQIRNCRDLKLTYDKLDLHTVDSFLKAAPAELTSVDQSDAHQLMLNRLAFELEERKRLCAEREALEANKKGLIQSNETKSNFMGSLRSKLMVLEETTKPIQEHLGIKTSRTASEYADADHLPRPLYLLYLQAVSFRDAFESSVTVHIEGDINAAIALASKQEEAEEEGKDEDAEDAYDTKRGSSKQDDAKDKSKIEAAERWWLGEEGLHLGNAERRRHI